MKAFNLEKLGIEKPRIYRNLSVPKLYEMALQNEKGSIISDKGALLVYSGDKTGRSPKDRRIVKHPDSENNIDWGNVNLPLDDHTFMINKVRAIDYLNSREIIYVFDGFAGWDSKYRIKVRIICTRAYHALFMNNMLIRPTKDELKSFGEPDYTVMNAGAFPANKYTNQMTSQTSVALDFEKREIVILGTEYAGEMKKGIFTVMNYLMPLRGVMPMHCSANVGKNGDVSIFFGLSGTGKTTLSADPARSLIGDDEHCWTDRGVFNIEGGCYAKAINLSSEKEPEIFNAIKFGTVLENVAYDEKTRAVDYDDISITENTRAAYPIEFINNAHIPCIAGKPNNIIFLTCDAYGVLPPVSQLTPEQASYHFISGYTAKVAGTEMGVTEPSATFSACFGAAFMPWHPNKYAELLAEKIKECGAKAWLVNTGWTGGPYGIGSRIKLKYTRAIIDAIHNNSFDNMEMIDEPTFGFKIPTSCPEVPFELLEPKETWVDKKGYENTLKKLADLFKNNFKKYEKGVNKEIVDAGPK
ncbi:MAG: phosphoenolpyruvate carboxykinase (ATP) [Saprospiraceae bacterium]|nr:phosphoenolpyruvate carboxykinase (ATP) [Saprospiraceae bacterium]